MNSPSKQSPDISPVIVTDANLWLHAIIPAHQYHIEALDFIQQCIKHNVHLIAPPLWEAEIDSSLRKMHSVKYINKQAFNAALQWIDASPIDIIHYTETRFLARKIADIIHVPRVYDATYAALAKLRDADFWTADVRFFNSIKNGQSKQLSQVIPKVHFILEHNSIINK